MISYDIISYDIISSAIRRVLYVARVGEDGARAEGATTVDAGPAADVEATYVPARRLVGLGFRV